MNKLTRILLVLLALLLSFCACAEVLADDTMAMRGDDLFVEYGEYYYTDEEVALYLHAFCELPDNYITKKEADDLGWSKGGDLWAVADGMCIGGDRFGNREGLLPNAKGRQWYECDVNYYGGHRGAERLLFSSDGLIYYTGDHYTTAELLYDGWYEED